MTLLQTLLRITSFRSPLVRTLIPSLSAAYTLQALVALPSIPLQTEKFYDLSGSLPKWSSLFTFLPTTPGTTTLPTFWNWRQLALSALVGIWATRLGTFLFYRLATTPGKTDHRFDEIRVSPPKFAAAFAAQATWVSICLLPVVAVNSLPGAALATVPRVVGTDIWGLGLWMAGFGIEAVADRQKSAWSRDKKDKKHDEDWCTRGLWRWSRHVNYVGEVMLWSGIAVVAGGVLVRQPVVQALGVAGSVGRGRAVVVGLCAVCPAFVYALLRFGSGVPISEKRYEQKFGGREDYEEWKRETPVFWPRVW